ncbi:MAG: ABC transporter ATP-binding protein [Bacteroidia bacterium]|nr:ABC transporter ATP-binding protein [Bacteroidia bacterium]
MLLIKNLAVTYQGKEAIRAVKGVSCELIEGKTTVLLGESGSGKTAISLAILNLLPANAQVSGAIYWKEEHRAPINLLSLSNKERRTWAGGNIGWVAQGAQSSLNPTRSIGSLLFEAIQSQRSLTKAEIQTEISSLIEELDLDPLHLQSYPHQLSGGERQRWLLALALSTTPRLLIADEPTTSLDILSEHHLLTLLQNIQAKRGLTLLLITHDLRVASRMGHQCLFLHQGKIDDQRGDFLSLVAREDSRLHQLWNTWTQEYRQPKMERSAEILHIRQLSVTYPSRGNWLRKGTASPALFPLDLRLFKTESLGIVGVSGSGKSTLAKAILDLIPYSGEILWNDTSSSVAKKVQLILQDSFASLHPRFTISYTLTEVLRVHRADLSPDRKRELLLNTLAKVKLPASCMDRFPGELSGGERQRVSIARALLVEPQLLILDESVASLDVMTQDEIIRLIHEIREANDLALMVISHDLRVVKALCQQVLILKKGRQIEKGPLASILTDTKDPYTLELLHAAAMAR